jgi:hypothetical protein
MPPGGRRPAASHDLAAVRVRGRLRRSICHFVVFPKYAACSFLLTLFDTWHNPCFFA